MAEMPHFTQDVIFIVWLLRDFAKTSMAVHIESNVSYLVEIIRSDFCVRKTSAIDSIYLRMYFCLVVSDTQLLTNR